MDSIRTQAHFDSTRSAVSLKCADLVPANKAWHYCIPVSCCLVLAFLLSCWIQCFLLNYTPMLQLTFWQSVTMNYTLVRLSIA